MGQKRGNSALDKSNAQRITMFELFVEFLMSPFGSAPLFASSQDLVNSAVGDSSPPCDGTGKCGLSAKDGYFTECKL